MSNVDQFISEYSATEESKICFAWNGKHGELFADSNYEFRKGVLDEVMKNPEAIDLLIIRDIFRAETEFSKEAWSIDRRVSRLAEALLKRGGTLYLDDYLIGRSQSFDAYLACGDVKLDNELAQNLIKLVQERLGQERDQSKRKILESGHEFFEKWVKTLSTH